MIQCITVGGSEVKVLTSDAKPGYIGLASKQEKEQGVCTGVTEFCLPASITPYAQPGLLGKRNEAPRPRPRAREGTGGMYRSERWPEEESPSRRSSRRSSGRRASLPRELSPPAPPAAASPRRNKPHQLDFLVTGKQILKKSDRASSLPGAYHRRLSSEAGASKPRKLTESPRRAPRPPPPAAPSTRDAALDEQLSLDLSQIQALATSTPRPPRPHGRSASVQSAPHRLRRAPAPTPAPTEVDYSSVSPEYSGQSSAELSPSRGSRDQLVSSCCVSTWPECSETDTAVESGGGAGSEGGAGGAGRAPCDGEWCSFWANYNNSMPHVPVQSYYDQCPTPYRTDTLDLADFTEPSLPPELDSPRRAPDRELLASVIRQQGLALSPRETQGVIKCAHLLGTVLARAIERSARAARKHNMTLDLHDAAPPAPPAPSAPSAPSSASATTQTDISLPNTRSAPRIFENILRQLSRSSLDVDKDKGEPKPDSGAEASTQQASSDPPSDPRPEL
ncbi:unnamed protein product [Spodoptera exigua]|nr:unnamed protein product [Spodoptera exigua]